MAPAENSRSESPRLPRNILLAAGGTGGHVYPALALGRALVEADPEIEISYCCGNRPVELNIYESAGVAPIVLPMSGRRSGHVNLIKFATEFRIASREARSFLARLKPDLTIGFGGYLSVPVLRAARRIGSATAIHEQNARPGLANRFLVGKAELVMTGVEHMTDYSSAALPWPDDRTVYTGNPVRSELLGEIDPARARKELGLPADGRVCLCFGGSLGAARINAMLTELLTGEAGANPSKPEGGESWGPLSDWRFLWAAGPADHPRVVADFEGSAGIPKGVIIVPFLDRMDLAYAAADVVLARAGALTLAEITALGKPAILVPLPRSAGGHQLANARALEDRKAAIVIEEKDPKAVKKIRNALGTLARDYDKLGRMARAAREAGKRDAASQMVRAIRSLSGS